MKNDDFLNMCKSIDPSVEVDREKNLKAIKSRLLKEEEQINMMKNKKAKRPVAVAAAIGAVLSLSVMVYAAAPMVWRYFDTGVIQGEEFVTEFFRGEIDLPDGTTSVGGSLNIDREALAAAGGGVIIVEVDGQEEVVLDELHLDNLQEGLALLQLDNILLPAYLPEGFTFSRFTFPVNPNNHEYMLGVIPAAKNASIHFSNEMGDGITLQIGPMSDITLGVGQDQQGFIINGKAAVLGGTLLNSQQIESIEGVALFEGDLFDETLHSFGGGRNDGLSHINVLYNGILYGISSENENVTSYDLVRMVASME